MKRILSVLAFAFVILGAGTASAHMFWVTLSESFNHKPGHITSLLGFGHTLPFDDLLGSEAGTIDLSKYELIGPDESHFDLGLPDFKNTPMQTTPTGMTVNAGDLGLRKIACTEKSAPGTYQVVSSTKTEFFTVYLDKAGKQRMVPKAMNEIKNLQKPLVSFGCQMFAKSFFALKKWTEPKPLGFGLEIMPLDDLSNVHVGDLVRFKVTFKGKPLNSSEAGFQRMTCHSKSFGDPDKFHLDSYLFDGIAQFRMPAAGQWLSNVYVKQNVTNNPQLKDLKGKCLDFWAVATVAFDVKP